MTYPASKSELRVHDLFIEQAARTPGNPAVITCSRTLSYGELLSLSRGYARRLLGLGIKPNELVAVVMEKGWEQIVAVLGILQSGAAYLPIDLNVPKERLWYLLQNGGVQIVLTQSRVDTSLEWPPNVVRVCVNEQVVEADDHSLDSAQSPDDLAYVLYTSGSTGTPKGVMIAHKGLVNCILDTNRTFQVSETDRVLALTALHHDMSVYDIFGLLAVGGAVVIPDQMQVRAPDAWMELIEQEEVTIWNSVPAFMEMMLEFAKSRDLHLPGYLRLAFLGGDWIPLTAPSRIRSHFGNVQVVSVGGPTETTLWNIWYPIKSVDPEWKSIPYGHAISNTRYYILDESLQDCDSGVPGELCCAGVGVMKGYWRDEERSRARLVTHPRTGELICRTGDRGRLRQDGEIEFLGRNDTQVKIAGQRIELGEIEATLATCSGVGKVVVSAIQVGAHKRLAAYVVSEGDESLTPQKLNSYLDSRLPCHMIPRAFVQLDSLPLNSNGKLDRNALPVPSAWTEDQNHKVVLDTDQDREPKSIESKIRDVWRKSLGLERIEAGDNFFDLGGNSVLLVETHSQLQQCLNREISITRLFEFPSIRSLAHFLDSQETGELTFSHLQSRADKQRSSKERNRRMTTRL